MAQFFSHDGSIDDRIASDLDFIVQRLLKSPFANELHTLALGGGYGRGEGGVWFDDAGNAQPYNDYDLVLVHDAPRKALAEWLATQRESWTKQCGVHVDIEPVSTSRLARLPHTLTWYEFAVGHRVVWGDAAILAKLNERRLESVPASEWGRLLVNRGMGILLGLWRMRPGPHLYGADEPCDRFAERQVRKAWLALGDVHLAQLGSYHHLLKQRLLAFAALSDAQRPAWSDRWQQAAQAKLLPTPLARDDIRQLFQEIVPVFSAYLTRMPSDGCRPCAGVIRSWQHLPLKTWLHSGPPWRSLRERVRYGILSGLNSDGFSLSPFCDQAGLITAWEACA